MQSVRCVCVFEFGNRINKTVQLLNLLPQIPVMQGAFPEHQTLTLRPRSRLAPRPIILIFKILNSPLWLVDFQPLGNQPQTPVFGTLPLTPTPASCLAATPVR